MKFTDGFWLLREGVDAVYAQEAYELRADGQSLSVTAPTKTIQARGDVLNRPTITVVLTSPLPGIIGVEIQHFRAARAKRGFDLIGAEAGHGVVTVDGSAGRLESGDLTAVVSRGAPWSLTFESDGQVLTRSAQKSLAYLTTAADADLHWGPVERARRDGGGSLASSFIHAQLDLGVGEHIYGLGERFGPLVKNGQGIDIWNADGGTSSEQAYKNVPFYLSDGGYGVLVDDTGHVSFEVGSELVERVQFSAAGESLRFFVIAGDPETVLERYTALTGRPPAVPAWSYGLWLSTSFTTDYDEATVSGFLDEMAARQLPVSVMHFDCFWMREFRWTDFEWDARVFPDPEGMLARLHGRDLRVSVWINPYIAQDASIFSEAAAAGYLLRRPGGEVWQSDLWQAGMGMVDFTNPDARQWYQDKLRFLLDQGVDCFKTDFGERVPLDVIYYDGSSPADMHNLYAQLYNEAVFEVLSERQGDDAIVFARSATVGGQRQPVHWGGDSTSTFASMAETLRGGLSLAMSGFSFWSHDIGGFEGTPDPDVFKRWLAFGLLSSHSRLHGSDSYRVPWAFDDEAVAVAVAFTTLKIQLMPYLYAAGHRASECGIPVMRPMQVAFPNDPAVAYLDRQYMLGPDVMVAPVFTAGGDVEFYLPDGEWMHVLSGSVVRGGTWRREKHDVLSLPLYVRRGTVLPRHDRSDRPDHPYLDGLVLEWYPDDTPGERTVEVVEPGGRRESFRVQWGDGRVWATSDVREKWSLRVAGQKAQGQAQDGKADVTW